MILKTLLTIVVCQAVLLSVYLIFNLPLDLSIISVTLIGLGLAVIYVTINGQKDVDKIKREAEEAE